jgi:hypothetical protein
MSTTHKNYIPTHPGKEFSGVVTPYLHVAETELEWSRSAANELAAKEGKFVLMSFGGRDAYVAARQTETKDNSGTIAYAAGGVRLQSQATPSDNDDVDTSSVETQVLAQDKWYTANIRAQVSSAANLAFCFGVCTSAAQPNNAAATDGVYFIKTKTGTALVGRVIENGNAANDSATLATVADATDLRLGFRFKAGSSAANSAGYWSVNGTVTNFTANQVTAIFNMLNTTAPTLMAHIGTRVNSTTQRNAVVSYALVEADR